METIKVRDLKNQFLTAEGLPKYGKKGTDNLKTIFDIYGNSKKKLSKNKFEKRYQLHYGYSALSNFRKHLRKHGILMIVFNPGSGEYDMFGFTNDTDKIIDFMNMIEGRKNRVITNAKEVKRIGSININQLLMFDKKKKQLK